MRVIHQEDMSLRILGEIALGDVLPVAAVVGEGQRVVVENPDKTFRPAAVLDIGLTVGACGGSETR
jgi:hypothetical protein